MFSNQRRARRRHIQNSATETELYARVVAHAHLLVGYLRGEDEVVVEVEGEQRLGQLAEEALEHGGAHVHHVQVQPLHALLGPLVQQPP